MNLLKFLFPKKEQPLPIEQPLYHWHEIRNKMSDILTKYYDSEYEEWYNESNIHLMVGDIAVLDKYDIQKGSNSWDGGVGLLNTKGLYPFDVVVTDIYGDKSLASEKVYKFLDKLDFHKVLDGRGEIKSNKLIAGYKKYCAINHNVFGLKTDNIFGFYFGVKYKIMDTNVVIQNWNLNSNCFIKKGTEAYNMTVRLWKQETDLYFQELEMRDSMNKFEKQKEYFYKMLKLELTVK